METIMRRVLLTILVLLMAVGIYSSINSYMYDKSQAIGMSQEEMLADFEYLYNKLERIYPSFQVLHRKYNYDWLANKDRYIGHIKGAKSDADFYKVIDKALSDFMGFGGIELISPSQYEYRCTNMSEDPYFMIYQDKFWTKEVSEYYRKWDKTITTSTPYQKRIIDFEDQMETNVLENDKIAYMKFSSFMGLQPLYATDDQTYEEKERILRFYKKIKDYPYLVIDIRDNKYGYDYYWQYYIMAPIVEKKNVMSTFIAYRKSNILDEYNPFFKFAKDNMDNMPIWLNTPKEIKDDFFRWDHTLTEIFPTANIPFEGKIYLLINEEVSGSAGVFTEFVKANRWATIVGRENNGTSYASGYIFFHLPNSKLIVKCNDSTTLNYQGHITEERGTLPDIIVDTETDILESVLDTINKEFN